MVVQVYSPDTLQIIGITYYVASSEVKTNRLTLYDGDMKILATSMSKSFYDEFFDGLVFNSQYADTTSSWAKYIVPGVDYSLAPICYGWTQLSFFDDSSVHNMTGEFYLGISYTENSITFRTPLTGFWYETHDAPYSFPNSNCKLKKIDGTWVDYQTARCIPMIFPIINPKCRAVEEVNVTVDSAGCLTATWDSLPTQEQWVVAFSSGGVTTLDTVDHACWQRCDMADGEPYHISVRSRCTNLRSYAWSPWYGGNPQEVAVQQPSAPDFRVSPNPTTGLVTVELAPADAAQLELYDNAGRCLQRQALPSGAGRTTLDLGDHPAGLYLLRLVTPTGVGTRKVVVQ